MFLLVGAVHDNFWRTRGRSRSPSFPGCRERENGQSICWGKFKCKYYYSTLLEAKQQWAITCTPYCIFSVLVFLAHSLLICISTILNSLLFMFLVFGAFFCYLVYTDSSPRFLMACQQNKFSFSFWFVFGSLRENQTAHLWAELIKYSPQSLKVLAS